MVPLVAALSVTLTLVAALPVTNSTTSIELETPFVSEPRGRGTIGLVFSCVITLTLCVWTAIHMNIVPRPSVRRALLYKGAFLLLGIFVPETMLATAFSEWREASKIARTAKLSEAATLAKNAASKAEGAADYVDGTLERAGHGLSARNREKIGAACEAARTAADNAKAAGGAAEEAAKAARVAAQTAQQAQVAEDAAFFAGEEADNVTQANNNQKNPAKRNSAAKKDAAAKQDTAAKKVRTPQWEAYFNAVEERQEADLNSIKEQKESERKQKTARKKSKKADAAARAVLRAAYKARITQAVNHPIESNPAAEISKKDFEHPAVRAWLSLWSCIAPSNEDMEYGFGKEGAFYAIMGGYTFLPPHTDPAPEPPTSTGDRLESALTPLTLTGDGLNFLLQHDVVTTDSLAKLKGEIVDKGKADTLTKCLVCTQALWMTVNCLSRKIFGLHITLLELNVVMHVLCAIATYYFWWWKPHNAKRPLPLPATVLNDRGRALVYAMPNSMWRMQASVDPDLGTAPTDPNAAPSPLTPEADLKIMSFTEEPVPATSNPPPPIWKENGEGLTRLNQTYKSYPSGGFALSMRKHRDNFEADLQGLTKAVTELRKQKSSGSASIIDFGEMYQLSTWDILAWTDAESPFNALRRSLDSPMIAVCAVYGGVHATVWNSHFPTPIERWLWRASCIIIGAPGIAIAFGWYFSYGIILLDRLPRRLRKKGLYRRLYRFLSRLWRTSVKVPDPMRPQVPDSG